MKKINTISLIVVTICIAVKVDAESYPKDPTLDYSGEPCAYFTKPPVDAEGARTNYHAEGSIVVYGQRTYECRKGVWRLFASSPSVFVDWKKRLAEVVEGYSDPNLGRTQTQAGPDRESESATGSKRTTNGPLSDEDVTQALNAAIPLIGELKKERDAQAARPSSPLGHTGGAKPPSTAGRTSNRISLQQCSDELNRRAPPSPTGNQCRDARALIEYYENSRTFLSEQCVPAGEVMQQINQLDSLISSTKAYRDSICT